MVKQRVIYMNLQELKDLKEEWKAEHRMVIDALDLVDGRMGSYRQRVMDCIVGEWKSVDQIEEMTALNAKRIRGVLYRPELNGSIEKRKEMNGTVLLFRIRPEEAVQESQKTNAIPGTTSNGTRNTSALKDTNS